MAHQHGFQRRSPSCGSSLIVILGASVFLELALLGWRSLDAAQIAATFATCQHGVSRRLLVATGTHTLGVLAAPSFIFASDDSPLAKRFSDDSIDKFPSGFVAPWGPSDLFVPAWMEGSWHVVATLDKVVAPLGLKFVSNGGSDIRAAQSTMDEQAKQLGVPVEYDLRFLKTARGNVVEDRLFNSESKINAYAGRPVVKRVRYADVPGSNREDATKRGDGPDDPLLTTVVYTKGAVQKVFITAFQSEPEATSADGASVWRGCQSTRTLFAAPSAGYNPLAVDEEVVTEFRRTAAGNILGRIRLLGFLNPNDPLFFQAGNKAVTIAEYALRFSRPAAEATLDPKPA